MAIINNIEDQVKFLEYVPHEKIFYWLDSIDIYVQSSFQKDLQLSVVEAMSMGLFCIGSDVEVILELLDDGYIFNIHIKSV